MMLDILTTNRENVLASFAAFRQRLDTVESFIQQDNFEALGVELAGGAMRRQVLVPAGG
jgi:prephenate dehydrogenase